MQPPSDSYMREPAPHSYLQRFLLGIACAFGVVFPATVAVGGRGHDLHSLAIGAAITLALAVLASSITAQLVRHSRIAVVLYAQALTVLGIGILNFFIF